MDRRRVVWAQDKPKEPPKLGWANSTDLSLVVTAGNSAAKTWGFSDELRHVWTDARFKFEANVVRSDTSDDRFFQVASGVEFPSGARQPTRRHRSSNLTRNGMSPRPPPRKLRTEHHREILLERGRELGPQRRRRHRQPVIAHAGVGNTWADTARRRFTTSYGISYTDREEKELDPEKDRRFAGGRLGWDYREQFNAATTFDHKFATNVNLADSSDYSIDTTSALTVAMAGRVSLKVSLQWLYENEPALESDLDVIALVELINPDGIPGSGDEFFRTLSSGGSKLVLGSADARNDKLDTIFKTAIVIKF